MPGKQVAHAAGHMSGFAAGLALGVAFGAVAVLRRGRPLHPQGVTLAATVRREGGGSSGVPWLDDAGVTEGAVRVSRAMGLPGRWPDIHGLALRMPKSESRSSDTADLLFASTGDSRWGRFVLVLRDSLADGPVTTLLPVRAPAGPLLLRLAPVHGAPVRPLGTGLAVPTRLALSYAVGTGPWVRVGEVVLGQPIEGEDDPRRHDPIVHQLPGTSQYPVVQALREPAYAAARLVAVRR